MSFPSIRTLPLSTLSSPERIESSVDLPLPLSPWTTRNSPSATERETESSTAIFRVPAV